MTAPFRHAVNVSVFHDCVPISGTASNLRQSPPSIEVRLVALIALQCVEGAVSQSFPHEVRNSPTCAASAFSPWNPQFILGQHLPRLSSRTQDVLTMAFTECHEREQLVSSKVDIDVYDRASLLNPTDLKDLILSNLRSERL